MKLLTQADDFGFTRGVTYGIVDSIDLGVLRNTGLFANSPSATFAVGFMKDRPQVCFGIDFNLVSGPTCTDPATIPDLVDSEGNLIRSNVRIHDPRWQSEEGRREMFPYEQVYREMRAQYDHFVELAGKKPGYLHGHSLSYETFREAIHRLSEETGVPVTNEIWDKFDHATMFDLRKNHPSPDDAKSASKTKSFDPISQLNKNPLKLVLDYGDELLAKPYALVGGHAGYLDADLLSRTSLSIERIRDAELMQSQDFKQWIEENHVELITYYDLVKAL